MQTFDVCCTCDTPCAKRKQVLRFAQYPGECTLNIASCRRNKNKLVQRIEWLNHAAHCALLRAKTSQNKAQLIAIANSALQHGADLLRELLLLNRKLRVA